MNLRSENCTFHVSLPRQLLDNGRNIGFYCPEPLSDCTLRSLAWPLLSSLPVSHSKCLLLLQHFISVLLKHIPGYHIFYSSGIALIYVLTGWFELRLLEGLHFWWDYCCLSMPSQFEGVSLLFSQRPISPIVLLKDLCIRHSHPKSPKIMIEVWKQIWLFICSLSLLTWALGPLLSIYLSLNSPLCVLNLPWFSTGLSSISKPQNLLAKGLGFQPSPVNLTHSQISLSAALFIFWFSEIFFTLMFLMHAFLLNPHSLCVWWATS